MIINTRYYYYLMSWLYIMVSFIITLSYRVPLTDIEVHSSICPSVRISDASLHLSVLSGRTDIVQFRPPVCLSEAFKAKMHFHFKACGNTYNERACQMLIIDTVII